MHTKNNELPKFGSDKRRLYMSKMSHEIRTPMNAIMGLSQILLRQVQNPEEREYLLAMETATQSLLMTVNNVLDYESMLSGDINISMEEFELPSLVEEIASIGKINIGQGNVRFIVDADPDLPKLVKGDCVRIKQVLTYLLSNAEKFTNEGYITLKVSQESVGKNAQISFSVTDTGRGFTDEDMEIMIKDYELNGFPSPNDDYGIGLGLTIANSLVDLMGSSLIMDSEAGVGSNIHFTLNLPVVEDVREEIKDSLGLNAGVLLNDDKERDILEKVLTKKGVPFVSLNNTGDIFISHGKNPISHLFIDVDVYERIKDVKEIKELGLTFVPVIDSVKQASPGKNVEFLRRPIWYKQIVDALNGDAYSPCGGMGKLKETIVVNNARVLLVDDNDINLKVTKGLLKPYDIIVDTANSGEEAIELVKAGKYDIVYMDHMMPGMDGMEATQIIRELDDPYYRSLPIVALSANAIDGMEEMFLMAGMNDFVAKPVTIKDMEKSLKKWLPAEKVMTGYVEVKEVEANESIFRGFKIIDVNAGLGYTNGNAEMYGLIVKDFAATLPEKKDFINELAKEEDIGRFTIEVHALKSTSKTIGATRLSDKALELERLGHKRDMVAIMEKLPMLNAEIELVLEDLKPLIVSSEVKVKRVPIDREKVREELRKLFYAADDFDYENARQIIIDLGGYEYDERMETVYIKLRDSIEDIDYEETRKGALFMLANL